MNSDQIIMISGSHFYTSHENNLFISSSSELYTYDGEFANTALSIIELSGNHDITLNNLLSLTPLDKLNITKTVIFTLIKIGFVYLTSGTKPKNTLTPPQYNTEVEQNKVITLIGNGIILYSIAISLSSFLETDINIVWIDNRDECNCSIFTQLKSELVMKSKNRRFMFEFVQDGNFDDVQNIYINTEIIVLSTEYLNPLLPLRINSVCNTKKIPWILVRAYGRQIILGPFVVPNKTPCYECYVQSNKKMSKYHAQYKQLSEYEKRFCLIKNESISDNSAHIASCFVLEEIKKFFNRNITFELPATMGKIITIDLSTFSVERNMFIKRPRCVECSRNLDEPNYWMS